MGDPIFFTTAIGYAITRRQKKLSQPNVTCY